MERIAVAAKEAVAFRSEKSFSFLCWVSIALCWWLTRPMHVDENLEHMLFRFAVPR
jgi:hypothetical protein